jgi:amidase
MTLSGTSAEEEKMTMDEICRGSLAHAAALLESRSVSPVELTSAMLDRIDRLNPHVRAYVHVDGERALDAARAAEAEIADDRYRGPLHGIPLGVKDIIDTADMPTECGSFIHEGRRPAQDATAVSRLRDAGTVLLGKHATTEFAWIGYPPGKVPPLNPWNLAHWAGASSSGSGASVAASLAFGSFGTDTGGSIRFPAAVNGVVGLKPTHGRVSSHGVQPLAHSLDHVGPFGRTVRDAALLYQATAGPDPADPGCLRAPAEQVVAGLGEGVRGLRIGVDRGYWEAYATPEVVAATEAASEALVRAGAVLVPVDIRAITAVCHHLTLVCGVEALEHQREIYPSRADELGVNYREILEIGFKATAAELAEAVIDRRRTDTLLTSVFGQVDLLLTPGAGTAAPTMADFGTEPAMAPDALEATVAFSTPFNFSGHPTLSLPSGLDEHGLPLGIQLIGRHLHEATLLRTGHTLEAEIGFTATPGLPA